MKTNARTAGKSQAMTSKAPKGKNNIGKTVAGGATGAVVGAMIGGPVGAVLGGMVGTAVVTVAGKTLPKVKHPRSKSSRPGNVQKPVATHSKKHRGKLSNRSSNQPAARSSLKEKAKKNGKMTPRQKQFSKKKRI